jgi:shikimate dehydrogenase
MAPEKWHFAIVGHPISHTLSPHLHQFFIDKLGLQGQYDALDLPVDEFSDWLDSGKWRAYHGINITIPYKTKLQSLPLEFHDTVKLTGAVNTLRPLNKTRWEAHNTDVWGFESSLPKATRESLQGKSVLLIGAGGSARAVAYALLNQHIGQLFIKVRPSSYYQPTYAAIESMRSLLGANTRISVVTTWDTPALRPDRFAMVINSTPLGMLNNPENTDDMPAPEEFIQKLATRCLVYDLIYNPVETPFLATAKAAGLKTQNGLTMLIHQGAKAFEAWTGQTVPDELLSEAFTLLSQRLEAAAVPA